MKNFISGRISLWGTAVLLAVIVAATILNINVSSGTAQSVGGFGSFIGEVKPDPGTLASLPSGDGPFYLEGKIYPLKSINEDGSLKTSVNLNPCAAGGSELGVWRAWGYKKGNTLVSNQEFWLPCYNGVIEAQGVIGRTQLAIEGNGGKSTESFVTTGGLGTFRSAFGECQLKSIDGAALQLDKPFRVEVLETNRRPNQSSN